MNNLNLIFGRHASSIAKIFNELRGRNLTTLGIRIQPVFRVRCSIVIVINVKDKNYFQIV